RSMPLPDTTRFRSAVRGHGVARVLENGPLTHGQLVPEDEAVQARPAARRPAPVVARQRRPEVAAQARVVHFVLIDRADGLVPQDDFVEVHKPAAVIHVVVAVARTRPAALPRAADENLLAAFYDMALAEEKRPEGIVAGQRHVRGAAAGERRDQLHAGPGRIRARPARAGGVRTGRGRRG